MKIVHLCLGSFFPDNYSYQENMLPKYHKTLGFDVEVIASLATFDKDGVSTFLKKGSIYQNEYNIRVTRLDYKVPVKLYRKLKRYVGTFEALKMAKPDILFIHGCQFMDMDVVARYIKSCSQIKVYVDNHADFSNSATNWFSKNILHKILWRHCAHIIEPFAKKFYGVLPARVEFLKNIYKLPAEKCELLVMGADDDKVEEAQQIEVRREIRKKYEIAEDDFLIMTGGKIDPWKTQTLLLMEAVLKINNPKVKLIIFGSVTPSLKEEFNKLCLDKKVMYIGWIKADDSYKYFSSADLVVFPGRHSVFWEQVVGLGVPMICKYWDGTTHVDVGGNVKFLMNDSVQELENTINQIIEHDYEKMKEAANNIGRKQFSYKEIAIKAIQ